MSDMKDYISKVDDLLQQIAEIVNITDEDKVYHNFLY